jgi:hypothetical protein
MSLKAPRQSFNNRLLVGLLTTLLMLRHSCHSFEMEIRQTFSFVAIAPMFVICWSREKGFFRADKYCGFHALQALGWEN